MRMHNLKGGETLPTAGTNRCFSKVPILFLVVCAVAMGSNHHGSCDTEDEYRVLLVGDSWAAASWLHGSLREAFAEMGYPSVWEKGDVTAIGGSRADQWKGPDKLDLVTQELASFPSIDCVHIFLGGNDFVNAWDTTLTPTETDRRLRRIVEDLGILVNHCLAQRSNVKVVLCGYDYLNFVEPAVAGEVPWCASDSVKEELGNPSPRELNEALAKLEEHKAALAEPNHRVFHVNNFGQMQYQFGYSSKGIPPLVLEPPGNPEWPTPPEALNDGVDCMHLSGEGYLVLARNCCAQFYGEYFK